jgi:hypothetical protein
MTVRVSGSIETAIKESGVGRETYFRWKRRVSTDKGTALERRFILAVNEAERMTKLMLESKMDKAFDKNWRLIAAWLARRYPDEYGRRRPPPLPPDAV